MKMAKVIKNIVIVAVLSALGVIFGLLLYFMFVFCFLCILRLDTIVSILLSCCLSATIVFSCFYAGIKLAGKEIGKVIEWEQSKKGDMICTVFLLVFGAFFVFLGVINLFGLTESAYEGGLILILMSISFTKYKAYAKYYVPTLLICGVILTILGINLLYATHCGLVYATGLGVLTGGIVNFIVVFGGKRKERNESV
mgnify:CR=1 FL=1